MLATDRILNNDIDNYLYPFFWLNENESMEEIEHAIIRAYQSGCNGICVESRGFEDFKKSWWEKLDLIFAVCERLGMKVLVVDEDSKCPTGHAYGLTAKEENKKLRKESLVEMHVDVVGPCKKDFVVGETSFRRACKNRDRLIGAFLYKRTDGEQGIDINSGIEITDNIKKGILSIEVPKGNYRIFYIYRTFKYTELNGDDFIDFINKDSVKLLVDNVYEDYKRRYGHLFGKTFIGFFSDEPAIGNCYYYNASLGTKSGFDIKIGTPGITLPWTDELKTKLDTLSGKDCRVLLPALWFTDKNVSPKIREDYMDVLSMLYRNHFTMQIGEWCKKNGMQYWGHVLEDNNLHCRFGNGAGHYFRSQEGQTLPGIDIVLHQLFPDFPDSDYCGTASMQMNGKMYQYILGKLNSSAGHTYSQFDGKSMCEVTIGYGWAEGTRLAKWLFDYLLVRGTNHFVPGAIRPHFIDNLHSPHFGAENDQEPQIFGVGKLFRYANKASMLLTGEHIANACILYHARNEWSNLDGEYGFMENSAKVLYDNHIDFDILSEDLLDKVEVINGKICIQKEKFDCLVVPYAKYMSEQMQSKLHCLKENGADVVFTGGLPNNLKYDFNCISVEDIANYFIEKGYYDISMPENHYVRHIHFKNGENDVYMFSNESTLNTHKISAKIKNKGNCNIYDLLGDCYYKYNCNNELNLTLEPYQSYIIVFEEDKGFADYKTAFNFDEKQLDLTYNVSLYSYDKMSEVSETFTMNELKPISEERPNFSGKIEYNSWLNIEPSSKTYLEFENVGENAQLFVNGVSCGIRVCPPYRFEITDQVKVGENKITLNVYTTLANAIKDPVSLFVPIEPTGAHGRVILKTKH